MQVQYKGFALIVLILSQSVMQIQVLVEGVCAKMSIFSNVNPKQIDVADVPVVALQNLAKRHLRLLDLEDAPLNTRFNRFGKSIAHLGEHNTLMIRN